MYWIYWLGYLDWNEIKVMIGGLGLLGLFLVSPIGRRALEWVKTKSKAGAKAAPATRLEVIDFDCPHCGAPAEIMPEEVEESTTPCPGCGEPVILEFV